MGRPTRREFMGRLAGGAALAGLSEAALAAPLPDLGRGRPPDDEAYWRWVSEQFLVYPDIAYMNTGTRGPSPRSVVKAQVDAIRAYDADRLSYALYVDNEAFRDRLRARLAEFVGCNAGEIAMTNNTTEGMSIGTTGLDLKAGDEVIYTNHDHSSGAQPINLRAARQGIVPVVVDLSDPRFHPPESPDDIVAAIDAAITARTKLISFCHVNYTDGCVLPVKQICELARSKGILTLVDGAHPPGMVKLDLHELGCDMYAGAGHKWMTASMLTGFFYVREEYLDRVWPMNYSGPVQGLSMYGEPQAPGSLLDRSRSAAKYEIHGSNNYATAASLNAALDFHNGLTREAIEARVRHLAAQARSGLRRISGVTVHTSDDPRMSCGLVAFKVRGVDPIDVNDALWDRHHIYIRDVTLAPIDWAVNRASLHIMVHGGDVDRLVGAVEVIATERRA